MTTSPQTTGPSYDIRVAGHLDTRWRATFPAMTLSHLPDGTTLLRGPLPDQAALHGVLIRLRDAGIPLRAVSESDHDPDRMRAAVYRRFGGPDVVAVEQVDRPAPAPGELLVQVQASTVSAADHRTRARDIPRGLRLPSAAVVGWFRPRRPILGMELAGAVVAVGEGVTAFGPGDRVAAMLGGRFGGHAEYAIVTPADAVAGIPDSLSFQDAAALVFGGITAAAYLRQAEVGPGTRVLVNGASGAVGTAAVQLATAAGAIVTGVTSARNRELVASIGADHVIDYTTEDFVADGAEYDVVVDCVGNAPVGRVGAIVAPGGTVLLISADLGSLLSARRLSRRLGITVVTAPGPYRSEDLERVLTLAEQGAIRPVIDRTFAFAAIRDAHRLVDTGRKRGAVVVTAPFA